MTSPSGPGRLGPPPHELVLVPATDLRVLPQPLSLLYVDRDRRVYRLDDSGGSYDHSDRPLSPLDTELILALWARAQPRLPEADPAATRYLLLDQLRKDHP